MTLREKTLIIISVTFVGLILILYFISQNILLGSFTELEERNAYQNVERAVRALSDDFSSLESIAADWASWDDTYAFIDDASAEYIKSNLIDGTFIELRLNLILFINTSGQVVFGKAFDLHNEEEIPMPQSLQEHISVGDLLLHHTDTESSPNGIVLLSEDPMLVASQPILTSEDEGPIRGTLIMARYLDTAEISRLAEKTLLSLIAYRVDDIQMPPDLQEAQLSLSKEAPIVVRPLDAQHVAGYALITDIYGHPALMLSVDMPRDIYHHGQTSIAYLLLSMVVAGMVFACMTMLLLERQVLSRLARLNRSISGIGKSSDFSARVSVDGRDEVAELAGTVNVMMGALEQSSKVLQEKNEQLDAQNEELQSQAEELMAQRQELIEKTEEVGEVNRLKSEFLAHMSHELRTPLNVIIGFSQLMVDEVPGKVNTEQRQCLDDILSGGKHLLNLVNDVLDLSKIESGKVELKLADIDISDLIESLRSTTVTRLAQKEQSLEIEIEEGLPPVHADKTKIRQVFINLLGNSNKFTPVGGKIKIEAVRKDNWCQVSVVDNGIGIEQEEQERIFEPFYQVETSLATEKGTGLGLALTRQIIERHGGRIWVESEYGKGSRFIFALPLATTVSHIPGGKQ